MKRAASKIVTNGITVSLCQIWT